MASLPKLRHTQTVFSQSLSPGTTLHVETNVPTSDVISAIHRDKAMSAITESIKNNLVRDPNVVTKRDYSTGEFELEVDNSTFDETIQDTALSISEAKNQLDALPNLGLTKDIIISSVLSPNDMMSTELIYTNDSDLFGNVEPILTKVIEDYFTDKYQLTAKLTDWLEQSLMVEGAKALAVVPESSIDHAINTNLKITNESLNSEFDVKGNPKHIGLLCTPAYLKTAKSKSVNSLSLESFSVSADTSYISDIGNSPKWSLNVSVTDNPNVLKMPLINKKIREDKLAEVYNNYGFGIESFKQDIFKLTANDHDMYPARSGNSKPVLNLKSLDDLDKKTIGHPIVFEFPTEAVIPVYSPADPSDHVCYFLAVDESGNPLRMNQNSDQFRAMEQNFNNTGQGDVSASLIATASSMGMGNYNTDKQLGLSEMTKIYGQVIEQDLIQRLDGGGFHGKNLKLSQANELHRLMFVRALAQLNTRLVFIPKELMTYIAFDYKSNGVGRSLLDKTKILGSLRMVEVMTSAISNAKSSIDHRVVNIELDADDPDPMKRVTQFLHEFQRATKASFPMGVNSFANISDYLQKAGVQVKVSGHEGMPDMGMEVVNQRMDYNKPDPEYREKLDKEHIMALGAPPESVRSAEDIQFATNIISGNAYFSKISIGRQEIFTVHISDHIRKFTRNSQPLMDELVKVIKNNRNKLTKIDARYSDEAIALVFACNISVHLPKPDMAQNAMQLEAFQKYSEILDIALPAFVSAELFADINLGEKLGATVDHVIAVLKAHYLRKWLTDNNVLPELFELVNSTSDGKDKFDFLNDHDKRLDEIAPAVRDYLIKALKRSAYSDGVVEKAEELTGEEQNDFTGSSDTSYSSTDDSDSSDDENAGDEFSMDDDGMGDDNMSDFDL